MIPHKRALSRLASIIWNYGIRKRTVVGYPPYRLWIEPTNKCNLACIMCPNKDFSKDDLGFMDYEFYKDLIDQAIPFTHDINLHHRGEPTLHPRLIDMIRYADARGMKVKLHTNGTTLKESYAKDLLQSGLRLISFSFDGYAKHTYERIRVRSNFNRTLANIHRFLELKNALKVERLRTVMEIMEDLDESPDPGAKSAFIHALNSRGLNRLIIKKPHNWAGNVETTAETSTKFSACTFPWHALVVLWDGRVGACPHDFFAKIIYGNAEDTPLKEIFNSPHIQSLRSQMLEKSIAALKSPCRSCDSVRRKKIAGVPLASLKYLRD